MGKGIEIKTSINSRNLLAGITPTFSGWVQEPGTPDDMIKELDNTLTTHGIVPLLDIASMKYDLSSSKRIAFYFAYRETGGGLANALLEVSDDDITYTSLIDFVTVGSGGQAYVSALAKCRYIKFTAGNGGTELTTIGFRAYLI